MTDERQLLTHFVMEYPFQPATAFWRSIEIAAVLERAPLQGTVLDLGCGDGRLTQIVDRAWPGERRWVGIDPDPLEAESAKLRNFYRQLLVCPGEAVPLPAATFDAVFSNSVLEHIPQLEPVIAEAARLLRPGGRFLATVPSSDFRRCLRGPLLPWVVRARYETAVDQRLAHYNYLSTTQWRDLLGRHGIEVEGVEPFLDEREVRRWESLSRFTGGLLHSLFGGGTHPIQIQRRLGLRSGRERMPGSLARGVAAAIRLRRRAQNDGLFGCLLIDARKS